MVKDFVQHFSGGTDGSNITATTSAAGGDVFTIIVKNSGTDVTAAGDAMFTHSAAAALDGSMGARMATSGITALSYASWTIPTGHGRRAVIRVPVNIPSLPGATQTLTRIDAQSGLFSAVKINTAGKLTVSGGSPNADIVASTSTNALSLNTQYWLEHAATIGTTTSNGVVEYQLFTNSKPDGTGVDTLVTGISYTSGATINMGTDTEWGGTSSRFRVVIPLSTSGWTSVNTDAWRARVTTDTAAWLGPANPMSAAGTSVSTSAATGALSALLAGAGSSGSTSAASGSLNALVALAGQAASVSVSSGATTALLRAAGFAPSSSAAAGASSALLNTAGSAAGGSSVAGAVSVTRAPVLYAVTGAAASTSAITGEVVALLRAAGSTDVISVVIGTAHQDRDITVISVAEVVRPVVAVEVDRPFVVAEVARPFTATTAEGDVVNLNVNAREFYQLTIVTDPPVDGWEASFDDGVTWVAGDPVIRIANTWRWAVAGPNFDPLTPGFPSAAASTIPAGGVRPLVRAIDSPEVVVRRSGIPAIVLNR